MKQEKFKVLLYLKKSSPDKSGKTLWGASLLVVQWRSSAANYPALLSFGIHEKVDLMAKAVKQLK